MPGTESPPARPGPPREPPVLEIRTGCPALVLVFGGIKHGVGLELPPFEFLNSLSRRNCDAIFLRDYCQAWYQLGIEGIAADVAGLADWVGRQRQGHTRTVALGNSMGGFAALLLGRLARVDLSIAFNPQTTIDPGVLTAMGDTRWQPLLAQIYAREIDRRCFDVCNWPPTGMSFVFFGADSAVDRDHAMRLKHEHDARLFGVARSRHEAVRAMRDSGLLGRLLDLACDPSVSFAAMVAALRTGDQITDLADAETAAR